MVDSRSLGPRLVTHVIVAGTCFLLPYAQLSWFQFFHGTLALFLCHLLFARDKGIGAMGLRIPRRDLLLLAIATPLLLYAAWVLQGAVALERGLTRHPFPFPDDIDPLFQTLNEEIILGYLFLRAARSRLGNAATTVIAVALLFTLLHIVLYRFGNPASVWLHGATIVTLLAIGIARNASILTANHIGYAWALHATWNLVFLGGFWRDARCRILPEPEVFDTFLADPRVVATSIATAALTAWWLLRTDREVSERPHDAPSP